MRLLEITLQLIELHYSEWEEAEEEEAEREQRPSPRWLSHLRQRVRERGGGGPGSSHHWLSSATISGKEN